jgi:hypothetical protein
MKPCAARQEVKRLLLVHTGASAFGLSDSQQRVDSVETRNGHDRPLATHALSVNSTCLPVVRTERAPKAAHRTFSKYSVDSHVQTA